MVRVNGENWNIRFVEPSDGILRRSDNTVTVGVTDNNLKTVFLSNALHGAFLERVVAHEITHVFCFEFNLSLDAETEEILADFISLYGRDIVYLVDEILMGIARVA